MATRTVNSNDYFKPFRGKVRCQNAPEGASQTFKKGYPLKFSSTSSHENEVIVVGSDPTSGILGVADIDATGTQGSNINYWIADNDTEFIGVVQDGATTAYTNVGTNYSMVADGTNTIWRVDLSDTSNASVTVTGLVDPVGTVNGRVSFQFINTARTPFKG